MSFGAVTILGPGLIGGSLALAILERRLSRSIMLYAPEPAQLTAVRAARQPWRLTTDLATAVRGADLVILCTPIEEMAPLVERCRDELHPEALVTDVGSVKEPLERAIGPLLAGRALWMGGHPMTGSERSGFGAARADLFHGAKTILTPTEATRGSVAERRARALWEAVGATVLTLPPREHDAAMAQVSHLPHLVAAHLIDQITDPAVLATAGPGLRDTTRVASGSPELWLEILWSNRAQLALCLEDLIASLEKTRQILGSGEKSGLLAQLRRAHDRRLPLAATPKSN